MSGEALKRFVEDRDSPRIFGLGLGKTAAPLTQHLIPDISKNAGGDELSTVSDSSSVRLPHSIDGLLVPVNAFNAAGDDATTLDIHNIQSESSISTAPDVRALGETLYILGNPSEVILACMFNFVGCSVAFSADEFNNWYDHGLSHLKGRFPPPGSICIFCNKTFFQGGHEQWRKFSIHVARHLKKGLHVEEHARPDFHLINHLYKEGLISTELFDELINGNERPQLDGLRPQDYVPWSTREKELHKAERDNRIVIHEHWTSRIDKTWKGRHLKNKPGKRRNVTVKRIPPLASAAIIAPDEPVFTQRQENFQQLGALEATSTIRISDTPVRRNSNRSSSISTTTRSCTRGTSQSSLRDEITAQQYIISPTDFNTGLDNSSDDDDSTISSAHTTIKEGQNLVIPPTLDTDEDLVDPMGYRWRVQQIQHKIQHRSYLLQSKGTISSFPKRCPLQGCPCFTKAGTCSHTVTTPQDLLSRVRQNALLLLESGFYRDKISFLVIDVDRPNVASLKTIDLAGFLQQTQSLVLADLPPIRNTELPINEPRKVRPLRISRSARSSGDSNTSGSSDGSSNFDSNGESTDTASTSQPSQLMFLRVSDLPRDPQYIRRIDRGNVRVINHASRSEDKDAPRSGDARSCEYYISNQNRYASSKFKNPQTMEQGRYRANTYLNTDVTAAGRRKNSLYAPSDQTITTVQPASPRHLGERMKYSAAQSLKRVPVLREDVDPLPITALKPILGSTCNELLTILQSSDHDNSEGEILKLCTALNVLDLAILCFSRAHTGLIQGPSMHKRTAFTDFEISNGEVFETMTSNYFPHNRAVYLARRTLRCLDGFLGSDKAWVFHGGGTSPLSSETLLISATSDDFADVWGPMWKITASDQPAEILRYDLENGSIIPATPSIAATYEGLKRSDEIICHWVSDAMLRHTPTPDSLPHSFSPRNRLLVGAQPQHQLQENQNKCYCNPAHITQQLRDDDCLRPAGTCGPRRQTESVTVGVAIGGGALGPQVSGSIASKVLPGRTFKESLRKRWKYDGDSRNIYVLRKYHAVEMSICTQHSRRISLFDLIRTETIQKLLSTIDPIGDQACKAAILAALEKDVDAIIELYTTKPEMKLGIAQFLSLCWEILADTGTTEDPKEPITLFWMYEHEELLIQYSKDVFRWGGFVADFDKSFTFIVLEEKCLVFEIGRKCQHTTRKSKNVGENAQELKSIFQSALVINQKLPMPTGLHKQRKRRGETPFWNVSTISKGTTFSVGPHGSLEVIAQLAGRQLLVQWCAKHPIKAAVQNFVTKILDTESNLYHREDVGEQILDARLPIAIFVVA